MASGRRRWIEQIWRSSPVETGTTREQEAINRINAGSVAASATADGKASARWGLRRRRPRPTVRGSDGERLGLDDFLFTAESRPRRPQRYRTQPTLQMEAVECGAASLSMLLSYWGRHVPLEELRLRCSVSRNGANARDLVRAARSYGLEAIGAQMEIEDLKRISSPVIVFWAFQHFLVVEGFTRRMNQIMVSVNDPAGGRRLMSMAEFDEGFTGIVLLARAGRDLVKGGARPRLAAALRRRHIPSGRAMPLVFVASLLLAVPGIIGPAFNKVFLDSVLSGTNENFLWGLLGIMAASVAMLVGITAVQRATLARWESRLVLVSSARLLRHTLRLPVNFFMQRKAAELGQRISSLQRLAEVVSRDLVVSAVNMLLIVVYSVFLLRYDVGLGLIGIGTCVLNVVLVQWIVRTRRLVNDSLNADAGNLLAATFHTIQTIETIKATAGEDSAHMRWTGFYAKVVSGQQRLGRPTVALTVVPPLLASLNSGFILLIGGLRVIDGVLTVGVLMAFQSLLVAMNRPVVELSNLSNRIQSLRTEITRLDDLEQQPAEVTTTSSPPIEGGRLTGELRARDMGFAYSAGEERVVSGLTFDLRPGGRLALVGGSGSGKSTVGRLIAGLIEPTEGELLLDGRPRSDYARVVLGTSVGYVDQSVILFGGTVKSNVSMWDEEMPDDVVQRALADAEILETISQRPGGIHSTLIENGGSLSGGQRQRLEIARALTAEPTLLVLDEATSALDTETERKVMDNLARRGCSIVLIAHRLSTVREADMILVLDGGRIVERGTHDELVQLGGRYRSLVDASGGTDTEGVAA